MDTNEVDLRLEALGGLAAGIIGTVIGYPLDLVKTRMQTSTSKVVGRSNTMVQVGMNVLRQEGFTSLYKGMCPPLISLSILNTISFTSYNFFRNHHLIRADRGWDYRNAIAGMMVGPISSSISTVEHFIKTQMQMDNVKEKRYRGSWHCLTTLVKERGWRVIYTGHSVNSVREGVFLGTYFYTYEGCRVFLQSNFGNEDLATSSNGPRGSSGWTVPVAGGLSGAFAWFISFPLDCIKAGVQGQVLPSVMPGGNPTMNTVKTIQRMGSLDVLRMLLKSKGWSGLYAGVTPSILRAFLVSSTRFSAYEFVVWFGKDYLR